MILGEKIKKLRKERGWSQENLADKIKIHRKTIAFYELNKSQPSAEMLQKIATVFQVSNDYLLEDEPSNFSNLGIKDKSLIPVFLEIDKLDNGSKEIIKTMVESLSLRLKTKDTNKN
jgi:transcriptional regulator with XRE-family HTH domain